MMMVVVRVCVVFCRLLFEIICGRESDTSVTTSTSWLAKAAMEMSRVIDLRSQTPAVRDCEQAEC